MTEPRCLAVPSARILTQNKCLRGSACRKYALDGKFEAALLMNESPGALLNPTNSLEAKMRPGTPVGQTRGDSSTPEARIRFRCSH